MGASRGGVSQMPRQAAAALRASRAWACAQIDSGSGRGSRGYVLGMAVVSVRDLRNKGGRVLKRVASGEAVTVTLDGEPIAELRPVRRGGVSATMPHPLAYAPGGRPRQIPRRSRPRPRQLGVTDKGRHVPGMLDTNTLILLQRLEDPAMLPEEPVITAVTLAKLTVGPLIASSSRERIARQAHLQQAEADFDSLPFDAQAARAFGRVAASLRRSDAHRERPAALGRSAPRCG